MRIRHHRLAALAMALAAFALQGCSEPADNRVIDTFREHPGLTAEMPGAEDMNILVISFDALRADALGLYGYHRDTSPRLDTFARDAAVFDRAYSASNTTPTSFAAAFTGKYPYRVFLGWNLVPDTTLAQVMNDAGYYTFGLMNNIQVAAERHFDQGFDDYAVPGVGDDKVLQEAKRLLAETADRRFFGWVHFINPHTPYVYRDISAHLAPPMTEGRYAVTTGGKFDIQSDEELARVRDLYDGQVFYADHLFGELLDHLDSLGLSENTVIVVTSDHGEEFMEHGQVQHNAMYEELIRIPLLIRHPGKLGGSRSDIPYVAVDLLPTLAAMAGIGAPDDIDGIDLFHPFNADRYRLSVGMTNSKRQEFVSEKNSDKLIFGCADSTEELYDIETDPNERNDRILDDPQQAEILYEAMMRKTLKKPCRILRDAHRGKAPEELLSPEQIEKLKSLGYIQ